MHHLNKNVKNKSHISKEIRLKLTDVVDAGRIVSDELTILSPVRFQRGPMSGNETIYTKRKYRGIRRDSRLLPEIRMWSHEVPQFQHTAAKR